MSLIKKIKKKKKKKVYDFGSITLQGFGPNYNLCKKYKALILVTIYQN